MSFRNPVGPQPASVYWRRRILVLLGLIAVIAVIVLIVVRPGANAAPADPTPSPTATTEETDPAASPPPSAAPAPDAGADPAGVPACGPGQVEVTAITDKTTYGPEELPQLSWTIANVGAAPCTIDVGRTALVLTITSGDDTIWESTDCQTDAAESVPYELPPASPGAEPAKSTAFSWERQRSSPDTCGQPDRPTVGAGGASYHLSVSVGGFESTESAQFILN